MSLRKILNIFLLIALSINLAGLESVEAATTKSDVVLKQRQTKEKIQHLKWLENVETNKLYKNQQKLETATNNLTTSKTEILAMQKSLNSLDLQLLKASNEYNDLNNVLAEHLRSAYKSQRNARFQILLNSDDINMLVDRWYYQKLILKKDEERMLNSKAKAQQIALLKRNIEIKKRSLERSIASINTQQDYINKAIAKNKSMISKLQTDRAAYQRAERDLEKQSRQLEHYISRTTKLSENQTVSGFMKPIGGRITSPYGWRTHPIFNTRTFHSGVDIGGPNLGAIRASNTGKVIYTGWYGGYGKVVILEHGIINGKPITTLYAHMSSIAVSNGTKVQKGQVLGYEGTTGYSTGPHCHFEVRVNGQTSNPLNYIGT